MRTFFLLIGFFLCLNSYAQIVTVKTHSAVYEEPAISAQVLENLVPGTQLKVIGVSESWVQIETDNSTGFIRKMYLNDFDYSNIAPFKVKPPFTEEAQKLNGFRNSKWGMTLKQVRNSEKLVETQLIENVLIYNGSIAGLEASIFYKFIDNKLVTGSYLITGIHVTNDTYVKDYYDLQELLQEKYGKPTKNRIDWNNETFKDDPAFLSMAIGSGHVRYFTQWNLPSTKIILSLGGDKMTAKIIIHYSANEYEDLIEKEQSSRLSDGL